MPMVLEPPDHPLDEVPAPICLFVEGSSALFIATTK